MAILAIVKEKIILIKFNNEMSNNMKKYTFSLFLILFVTNLSQANNLYPPALYKSISKKIAENPNGGDITVLFAYTKRAAIDIGGGAQEIKKQVDNGMELLNTSLKNSNKPNT